MTTATFVELALSFPETEEKPHFDRRAYKVPGKRIFATLHEPTHSVNMKLSLEEQKTFCAFEEGGIYPVANKWGEQGWTTFELRGLPKEIVQEALDSAYQSVFSK